MNRRINRSFEEGILAIVTQTLVVLYITMFTIETLPSLRQYSGVFFIFDKIFLALFTAEYILRVISSPKKKKYILSFFGLVDLAAILPTLVSMGLINLQVIRLARLMRLFKIFKNKKLSAALLRLKLAFVQIRSELFVFIFIVIILLYFSAVGIYYFENKAQPDLFTSIPICLWWALTTFTTVGYGDMYPVTSGGRIFTGIILFIGIGLVAIPTGLIASSLSSMKEKE